MEAHIPPSTAALTRRKTDPRLPAAHNNAAWCDLVCRAHGLPTAFVDGLWVNRGPAPPFYSNAVTTTPSFTAAQLRAIRALLDSPLPPRWSVKDSFCALDLAPLGFEILFEAQWLSLPPAASLPAPASAACWERVATADGLAAWEAAWRGDDANTAAAAAPRIFLPALLAHPALVFLAAWLEDRLVGVAVLNRSDDGSGPVCGLSNLVLPGPAGETHRPGALLAARALFPGLPLVGYERGSDLAAMLALGFMALGPLRVWVRASPAAA